MLADLDDGDIRQLEDLKDKSVAQADIETAKTIRHMTLLDILYAITRRTSRTPSRVLS